MFLKWVLLTSRVNVVIRPESMLDYSFKTERLLGFDGSGTMWFAPILNLAPFVLI